MIIVIFLGLMTQGIRVTCVKVEFTAYLGILLTQVGTQFIKDIFEESVWRAYLTNQLIELKLSDLKLYLLVGFVWWIWHLPYIMQFLSERNPKYLAGWKVCILPYRDDNCCMLDGYVYRDF